MTTSIKNLVADYRKKRHSIQKRLKEFKHIHKGKDEDIFSELCFCLLTPQSNARFCDRAISDLKKRGLLYGGRADAIRPYVKGRARFHNKKSKYIVGARAFFKTKKGLSIKRIINNVDLYGTREFLVENIKGLGYKEASHFLRNIGLGKGITILDRHILKNLKRYGVIRAIPSSLSTKSYLAIEKKAQVFSRKINIPLEELDLLWWSQETGEIFK